MTNLEDFHDEWIPGERLKAYDTPRARAERAGVKRKNEDRYLVTVKLPKNQRHNPHDKVVGDCPVSGRTCTDVTGEHHSLIFVVPFGTPLDRVISECKQRFGHVTRIEEV